MGNGPLVSGIIIFLNAGDFLAEAIDSVLAQTYDHWELMLVDDGSTDKSTEIALCYVEQHPSKIRYLEHEGHQNRGMSRSRNLGISDAKGAYIAFLDADDVWLPKKLEQQVDILNACPEAMMVYGRTLIWNSWVGNSQDSHGDYTIPLGVQPDTLVSPPSLLLLLLQNKCQTPTTCNAMIRREIFDEIGKFEEQFEGMYEDQAFFVKVHLHVPVFVANECWAKYRQHNGSHSVLSNQTANYYSVRLPFLQWATDYLESEGVSRDSAVGQVLRAELWACHHPILHRLLNSPRILWWKLGGLLLHVRRCLLSVVFSGSVKI